jgi:hypothetical protein
VLEALRALGLRGATPYAKKCAPVCQPLLKCLSSPTVFVMARSDRESDFSHLEVTARPEVASRRSPELLRDRDRPFDADLHLRDVVRHVGCLRQRRCKPRYCCSTTARVKHKQLLTQRADSRNDGRNLSAGDATYFFEGSHAAFLDGVNVLDFSRGRVPSSKIGAACLTAVRVPERGTSGSVRRGPANPARPGREQRYRDRLVRRRPPGVPLTETLSAIRCRLSSSGLAVEMAAAPADS